MTKIYACLIGNWVCLNDDPKCKMGPNQVSPLVWWEENAYLYAPLTRLRTAFCVSQAVTDKQKS